MWLCLLSKNSASPTILFVRFSFSPYSWGVFFSLLTGTKLAWRANLTLSSYLSKVFIWVYTRRYVLPILETFQAYQYLLMEGLTNVQDPRKLSRQAQENHVLMEDRQNGISKQQPVLFAQQVTAAAALSIFQGRLCVAALPCGEQGLAK